MEAHESVTEKATKYLQEFKPLAADWYKQHTHLEKDFVFIQEFFRKERLEGIDWKQVQKLGEHLNCFRMPIARANALGKPNHPIDHYRKSFLYLLHGEEPLLKRIRKFADSDQYKLAYFGHGAVGEMAGYLFPDDLVIRNQRSKIAARVLSIRPASKPSSDFADRLFAFASAVKPITELYTAIIGRQTSLPVNLEMDQFFSWVSQEHGKIEYWVIAPGDKAFLWEELYGKGLIAIGWDELGNLKSYKSQDQILAKLKKLSKSDTNPINDARACYEFCYSIKPGDVVFAKKGIKVVVGYGEVESDYEFDESREMFQSIRKVKWLAKGEHELPGHLRFVQRTMMRITDKPELLEKLEEIFDDVGGESSTGPVESGPSAEPSYYHVGLFMGKNDFDLILRALRFKKNVILQGPPGTGKTYVARRLAHALMQSEDDSRIVMVQFHQSYSYEDFIQGFRPSGTGAFSLQNGTFYDFCTKARSDPQQKYMFIIDEINRGNLSKILGELMMLIEPDKRGEKYSLPLIYSPGEKFFCPPNVHLIGTMNTADRSLAMVDYALRRRFGFVDLKPEFESQAFTEYLAVNGVAPGIANRIVQQMTLLNDKIKEHKDLGKGYQIGHSYFCPPSEFSPRDTASYEEWYQDVIKLDVIPLLEEYLFDDPTTLGNWKQILLA